MQPLTIGVNALYLLPAAWAAPRSICAACWRAGEIDPVNRYVIFTNRETGPDLAPARPNFRVAQQAVRASRVRGGFCGSKPCWRWKRRGAAWM